MLSSPRSVTASVTPCRSPSASAIYKLQRQQHTPRCAVLYRDIQVLVHCSNSSSQQQLQGTQHRRELTLQHKGVCPHKHRALSTDGLSCYGLIPHGLHRPGRQAVAPRAVPDDATQPLSSMEGLSPQSGDLQAEYYGSLPTPGQTSGAAAQRTASTQGYSSSSAGAAEHAVNAGRDHQSRVHLTGQFRQQLKELLQQQQQLQQVLDATAGAQAGSSGKKRSKLRTAAAGSTDLLLSLLQSQLPLLTGQVGVGAATVGDLDPASSLSQQQRAPTTTRQQGRKQQQRPGAPAHVPLLAEALNTISWHCRRQQLLPGEAGRLQAIMLQHLLPALGPHLHMVNKRQLARVVFALGSCASSTWQEEQQGLERSSAAQDTREGASTASSGTAAADPADGSSSSSSRAAIPQVAAAAVSASWVRRLLPLLPPSSLTAGGLLAVFQGCALQGVVPPDSWLQGAAWALHGHLVRGKLDFNDTAGLLQACAALDFSPPGWLMMPLVAALQQQLGLLTPADLAGVLSSLQDLSYRPSDTWLRLWCEVSSRHLQGMAVDQLAAAAGAMAWTSYTPKPWWCRRLMAAALPLLPVATTDELLLLLHSLLTLRAAVDAGWVHEAYCHLALQQQQLGLSQLADAAHVLGSMSLPAKLVRIHRSWLASCLQRVGGWEGGAAAAALSRSELLYMLYAAARLRVSPGDTLLAAALHRLHAELPAATPAELAGCLSVFCYWWKHHHQQHTDSSSTGGAGGSRGAAASGGSTVTAVPGGADRSVESSRDSSQQVSRGSVVGLVQLRDCLSAVVSCTAKLSDEGLLQLLLTCAGLPSPAAVASDQDQQQQQQQREEEQSQLLADMQSSILVLVAALVGRLPAMGLVQLSRMSRALESRLSATSGGSGSSTSRGHKTAWLERLLQQVKAELASRA